MSIWSNATIGPGWRLFQLESESRLKEARGANATQCCPKRSLLHRLEVGRERKGKERETKDVETDFDKTICSGAQLWRNPLRSGCWLLGKRAAGRANIGVFVCQPGRFSSSFDSCFHLAAVGAQVGASAPELTTSEANERPKLKWTTCASFLSCRESRAVSLAKPPLNSACLRARLSLTSIHLIPVSMRFSFPFLSFPSVGATWKLFLEDTNYGASLMSIRLFWPLNVNFAAAISKARLVHH